MAVVVANMIGTGVFTSLGFQLVSIQSGFVLLMLWVVGGVAALCGAMSYAELGAALPRSGGEYNFLSQIYHPGAGFVSGWISATVGFTAPVALAALTFSAYASASIPLLASPLAQKLAAITLIIVLTLIHSSSHRNSGGLQNAFTVVKILVIVAFCITALIFSENTQPITVLPLPGDADLLVSGAFAVSLIYVSYAYTGWNVATYLSGEIENPQKTLPPVLIGGTLIVMLLYLSLNYVFLKVATVESMTGQIEIGAIAAKNAFGESAGQLASGALALLLISTVSAMTVAGPRVLQVVGEDFHALRFLGESNEDGIPATAIRLQSAFAILFILLADFQSILLFTGFTLALNSFATVLSLFVLRIRRPDLDRPYRVPAYPLTPLAYLTLTAWTLVYVLIKNPIEGLVGLGIVAAGTLIYFVIAMSDRRNTRRVS